jgi:hypothetical protein
MKNRSKTGLKIGLQGRAVFRSPAAAWAARPRRPTTDIEPRAGKDAGPADARFKFKHCNCGVGVKRSNIARACFQNVILLQLPFIGTGLQPGVESPRASQPF